MEYISADTIEDDNRHSIASNSLPTYYLVNMRATRNYLDSDNYKLPSMPGMTATIHIDRGRRKNRTAIYFKTPY